MSQNQFAYIRFVNPAEVILLILLAFIPLESTYSQDQNITSEYGIFDHIADWGTDEFPPKLGEYKVHGKVEIENEDGLVYHLYGNGDDLWGKTDEGIFLYTTRSGSWQISAKVEWIHNGRDMYVFVGTRPNACVSIRANPADASSEEYRAYVRTGGYGPNFGEVYSAWRTANQSRTSDFKVLDERNNSIRDEGDGVYIRVTRIAPLNLFYTSCSTDGVNWYTVHQTNFIMPETVAYGLSVSNAEDNEMLAHAEFRDVKIEPAPVITTRFLSSHTYRPLDYIDVILSVLNPTETQRNIQIEETIPQEWNVLYADQTPNVNENRLQWDFAAPPGYSQVKYTIQAPAEFSGMALFQGKVDDTSVMGNNAVLDSVTDLDSFRTHIFFRTVFLITPFVMGIIHIFLYIFLPRLRENLYYSLFLFGVTLHVSLATSETNSLAELEIVWYQGAMLAAFYINMLMLSLNSLVFNQRPAYFSWYFIVSLCIAALVHLTDDLTLKVTHNIVYTICLINTTRIAFLGLWYKKPGFSIIIIGVLAYNVSWWWLYIETAFHFIDPPYYIMPFSIIALIFSMSIYLSYWFAHLYSKMEILTGELEERVAARTKDITVANEKLNATVNKLAEAMKGAETANLAKSQFLARMSHEIRTPLTGLLGIGEVLQNTPLNPQQSNLLTSLRNAGSSLLHVINEILDFSKIETDNLNLELKEMNLYETVRESVESLKVLADNKFLYLQWSYADEVPKRVIGDPFRIRQILINLTGNAIKFTDAGSVIVSVNAQPGENGQMIFLFTIKDTGIGISKDSQNQIFDAFSQGDESTTRHYGGTGLGLSIVKKITDVMSGSIRVESEVDEGSTFYVEIPLNPLHDQEEVIVEKEKQPQSQFNATILLAEDDSVISQVTKEMLHFYGCDFIHVTNGQDAVTEFQSKPFHLVLMDYHMPEMDGITAAKAIRKYEDEQKRSNQIPILAVTANISPEAHEKCMDSGIQEVLKKPFTMDELQTVLKKWIPDFDYSAPSGKSDEPNAPIESSQTGSGSDNPFAAEPVFDPTPIEQIQMIQQPGSNLIGKVIQQYISDSEGIQNKLIHAVGDEKMDDIHLWAHRLVGSNVTIGGTRIAEIYRAIENSDNIQEIQTLLALTITEREALITTLKENFADDLE